MVRSRSLIRVERLEDRSVPSIVPTGMDGNYADSSVGVTGPAFRSAPRPRIALVTPPSNPTKVELLDATKAVRLGTITPFGEAYNGPVEAVLGDFNADGVMDVAVAAGAGSSPWVKIFDGTSLQEMITFLAYEPTFIGGVHLAADDVDADGRTDLVTGAGSGGGPRVDLFSGAELFPAPGLKAAITVTPKRSFFAYAETFTGGVNVAAGDTDGDGSAEIITGAGPGGGPHVKAFRGTDNDLLQSFFAYESTFKGGVSVAAGDVNGDGHAEIVTGPLAGGGPHVRIFAGSLPITEYSPFPTDSRTGISVITADVNRDGSDEILVSTLSNDVYDYRVVDPLTGLPVPNYPNKSFSGIHLGNP